jgi:hypothetical protein
VTLQIIIAAITGVMGFGLAWQLQAGNIEKLENEHAQSILVSERAAATTAIRRSEAVITAQSAATARAVALRRDADGSRAALVGLRDATDSALSAAATSLDACNSTASTLGELLGTVAQAGGDIAAAADRHASDVQTLKDSWPK